MRTRARETALRPVSRIRVCTCEDCAYTVYETHSRSCACLYKNKVRLCDCVCESDTVLRSTTCLGRCHRLREKREKEKRKRQNKNRPVVGPLFCARDHRRTYHASGIGVKSACRYAESFVFDEREMQVCTPVSVSPSVRLYVSFNEVRRDEVRLGFR